MAYPPGSGRARTAADGSYAMDLPPEQSYMIDVVDDEWAARAGPASSSARVSPGWARPAARAREP